MMNTTGRLSGCGTLAAAAVLGLGASLAGPVAVPAAERPSGLTYRNSLGMDLVRVEAGTFRMGISRARIPSQLREGRRFAMYGDFDERPVHPVTISRSFYVGAFEVTNAQYEQFDPAHRARRCRRRKGSPIVFPPRRSGSTPRARGRRPTSTPATGCPGPISRTPARAGSPR